MKRMLIFPLLLGLLALTGCSSDRTHASEESFFAMDTVMQFTVYGDDALLKDAQDVIADIESKASVTNPDSELYAINRDGSGVLTGRAAEIQLFHVGADFRPKHVIGDVLVVAAGN